jgi:hypothetical protein
MVSIAVDEMCQAAMMCCGDNKDEHGRHDALYSTENRYSGVCALELGSVARNCWRLDWLPE